MKKINHGLNQSRLFLSPIPDANGEIIKKSINKRIRNNNSEV